MPQYEYTLRPAPTRAEKHRALKTNAEKFAQTLTDVINELAREGWEFQRVESLPAEERSGLTSRITVTHNFLVFRREKPAPMARAAVTAEMAAPANGNAPLGETPKPMARLLSTSSNEGAAPRLGPAE